jgi:DNA-binding transcriptional MerR regulator
MTSGQLASVTGVSVDTLHHYEEKGVLDRPPRRGNAYRDYPDDAAQRVMTIRAALAVGFTLDELSRMFAMRAAGKPPCRTVRRLAAEKLEAIESRIAELIALRDSLRATLTDWDARLDSTADGQAAHLLESIRSRS